MIYKKYSKELNSSINIIKSLDEFDDFSINVYGSSDIDLIVMSKNFHNLNLEKIKLFLESKNLDFKEKHPIIIEDSLGKRIEFYLNYSRIPIDVTICSNLKIIL